MSRSIILYENMRAPVYIPYYLAQARDAFAAEGLDVDVRLSPGADADRRGPAHR